MALPTQGSDNRNHAARVRARARARAVSESGPSWLTVSAVARRMGVAPATLRTWDRRYGVGPTSHTAGAHRRYSPADVERLGVMRRLTHEGVAPAEAARVALLPSEPSDPSTTSLSDPPAQLPPQRRDPDGPVDARPADAAADVETASGGGRVVALGSEALPAARGLARAAMALDSATCEDLIVRSLREVGVLQTWEQVVMPVLVGVGERWARTGEGIEVEHLLTESVLAAHRPLARASAPVNPRPVLLASVEEDMHGLVLHVLAAALAERRVQVRLLGTRVPQHALASAVTRVGPVAVFLWSSLAASHPSDQLADLPTQRPNPRLFVGGPGWERVRLPAGARRLHSLEDAVAELTASATG